MSNSPREIEPSERALDKPAQSVAAGRPESGFFQRLRDVARPGLMYAVPPVVVLALGGVSWEIWTRISNTPEYIVPAPTKVIARLSGDMGFFAGHGAVTLAEAIAGFLLGAAVALVGATLMAHSRVAERSLFPLAILVKVTPVVAVAPLFVIWFGFGPIPKVLIASLITFFPVLVNGVTGLDALAQGRAERGVPHS